MKPLQRVKQNTWRVIKGEKPLKPMDEIVAYFQKYIGTYHEQPGYKSFTDECLIDDVLYGLGVSLDDKYRMAAGYRDFKELLIKHIENSK